MPYQLLFTASAQKDLAKLDSVTKKRLAKKLQYFINLPDPLKAAEKLVSPKIGTYRWRVGDYRIVFDLIASKVIVLRIRHRREVYRDL